MGAHYTSLWLRVDGGLGRRELGVGQRAGNSATIGWSLR